MIIASRLNQNVIIVRGQVVFKDTNMSNAIIVKALVKC
jgi:hypothetical protein